jgi:PAS domain S-box-containing protein
MDQRSFQRVLRRTVALPVTLLVLLALILAIESLVLSRSFHWVNHSAQVLNVVRQLSRYLGDLDTALHGYTLTGDHSFLEAYQDAKGHVPEQFDLLASLTTDNPEQQQRLERLRDADLRWMQWAERQRQAREHGPLSSDTLLAGHDLMEAARAKLRDFATAEAALQEHRAKRAELLNNIADATSLGMALLIAGLLFTITRRELLALSSNYERHLQSEAEQRRKASESREWFQSTLNSLGEAVISTDPSGTISYINPVAQQLTGWEHSRAKGRKFGEVVVLTDERTQSAADDPIAAIKAARKVVVVPHDLLLKSEDGFTRPIELTGAPTLDRRGNLLGVTVVFRDVTQRRQTEQTLRSSERLTLAGRLSATIAHEIRNPLDTVSNLVYLLQHDAPSPSQAQYLSLAGEEVARIAQITSQLLTFHRESRSPVPVNVTEVLESVLALFAPQIKQNHIEIVKRFDTEKSVRGFPGELRQVFSNLVGNAVEILPRGGRLVLHVRESSLVSDPARKGVRVTVLDTGAGIPAGVRKNLFAPFYTTKGEKGTGLGLWISRSIVEKHEGTIHLVSRTSNGNSGTAFSVFLPFEQELGLLDMHAAPPV